MPLARTLRLHVSDNLLVALETIEPGTMLPEGIVAGARVPRGHKIAARAITGGEPILKFGQIIGFATTDIAPGTWLHEHNVVMKDFARDYAFGQDYRPTDMVPIPATFEGYKRANGKVGTRNYIGILTSVNCSASVATFIAKEIEQSGLLREYPHVDGVIPLVHGGG
ncbi:MAG TPA: UxaA family hydrolase, partial [Rhabdaerophilum sp.]|nr:UxaA family hydrolase [Rhabdaerophilum sp.]